MNTYLVTYSGNATRLKKLAVKIEANSQREAAEKVFALYCETNYFPEKDGEFGSIIRSCDGNILATENDYSIEYDGGVFYAELITE